MPTIHRTMTLASGDSMELLETSAMTGGAYVRTRILFRPGGLEVQPHVHVHQDERYDILSGRLSYLLGGKREIAGAGTTVMLPRGVPHQHYSAGPEDTIVIQTVTPGLDFDYLIENIFGLGSEGRAITGIDNMIQGLVWIRGLRSTLVVASIPVGVQMFLATIATPFARLIGYRPVYHRFSGEDW